MKERDRERERERDRERRRVRETGRERDFHFSKSLSGSPNCHMPTLDIRITFVQDENR